MWLNADVGEGLETDSLLYPYLDQANIACTGHAGDQDSMHQAVKACAKNSVMIGAHPSYPDRGSFGRVSMQIDNVTLMSSLLRQVQALDQICEKLDVTLRYIKPHGALYHDVIARTGLFDLMLELVSTYPKKLDLLLASYLPDTYHVKAKQRGITLVREAFADRQYQTNGQLVARNQIDAVFDTTDKILAQTLEIKQGRAVTSDGDIIAITADSLCLHGDNPASVQAAEAVAGLLCA